MPAPGDVRNCIVALAEDEALLSQLFQYRFKAGEGLEGHSFGNLFLSALAEMTGDFSKAVEHSAAILATRGNIYPATTQQRAALCRDGRRLVRSRRDQHHRQRPPHCGAADGARQRQALARDAGGDRER